MGALRRARAPRCHLVGSGLVRAEAKKVLATHHTVGRLAGVQESAIGIDPPLANPPESARGY